MGLRQQCRAPHETADPEGDSFREARWEEASHLVVQPLAEIKADNGPDAIEFIASSK